MVAGALLLWGEAGGAGLVQPGRGGDLGRSSVSSLLVPLRRSLGRWSQLFIVKERDNRNKLLQVRFRLDKGRNFVLIWGLWSNGTGCSEFVWSLFLEALRCYMIKLWAAEFDLRADSALRSRVRLKPPEVPSTLNFSLWTYVALWEIRSF